MASSNYIKVRLFKIECNDKNSKAIGCPKTFKGTIYQLRKKLGNLFDENNVIFSNGCDISIAVARNNKFEFVKVGTFYVDAINWYFRPADSDFGDLRVRRDGRLYQNDSADTGYWD